MLPACVNLKPVPSDSKSYTLGPVEMEHRGQSTEANLPIYIIRPQVPTYMENSRLSYRSASGEVIHVSGARWAEPLAEGIARAMSLYLSESGMGPIGGYYPWPNASDDAARLSLNFQRFGATEAGEVQVVVRWRLAIPEGKSKTGEFVSDAHSWVIGEPSTLVAAYNIALQALALHLKESLVQN